MRDPGSEVGAIGHFRVSLCLCFKTSLRVKTILMKITLICMKMKTACGTHFHMNGFALRLVLKQRRKRTRKWCTKSGGLLELL